MILDWASDRGWTSSGSKLFAGEGLPDPGDIDWLVVMGGPMNVYEDEVHPWLPAEKRFIDRTLGDGAVVLGVCLGAQLLADVLGARVTRNEVPEIGWYPVTLTAEGQASPAFGRLPAEFTALHWHGDTFALPDGAVHLAESAACEGQAFAWGERVFGVQFHLECTPTGLADLVAEAGDELVPGPWIQTADEILGRPAVLDESGRLMRALLDGIADATA